MRVEAGARAALRMPMPWVILAVGVVLSLWAAEAARSGHDEKTRLTFERRVDLATNAIRARMLAYEYILRGGAAFLGARRDVRREEWARYVGALGMERAYPGIQALGYSRRLAEGERAAHVKRMRAEGFPEYELRPPGERAEYHAIVFNEPAVGRNLRVLGFDMFSESVRRAAMERARDTGEASATGRVVLAGEAFRGQQAQQPGLVMYMPVYKPGMPVASPEERRAALAGFVFGAFRILDLLKGILDDSALQSIDLEVFDGKTVSAGTLFLDRRGALRAASPGADGPLQRRVEVQVAGRPWTLFFAAEPDFEDAFAKGLPNLLLAAGLAASLLMFATTVLLLQARMNAVRLSLRDPLTDLFNRRYLDETMLRELPRATREGQPIGLVMADLDHFKRLNDSFGHDAGDHVLRAFGAIMAAQARQGDIACRYGGEEFVLVLPGASLEVAQARAESLRRVLESERHEFGGRPLGTVTLSAGVAAFPANGATWDELLQSADRALYLAKQGGRNRIEAAWRPARPS